MSNRPIDPLFKVSHNERRSSKQTIPYDHKVIQPATTAAMKGGPLNFGVEKLESAVHKNVAIKVQGGQLVGANSVILAVNSPLLDDVISRQQRSIVEISR